MKGTTRQFGQLRLQVGVYLVAGTLVLPMVRLGLPVAFGAEESSPGQNPQHLPANPDASATQSQNADLEAQLEQARKQLEQAARQVAALSAQLSSRAWGGRRLRRSVVGVQLDPSSPRDGARVLEVSPGGAAAEAGVHAGDLIRTVNGKTIAGADTAAEVVALLRDVPPDTPVRLGIRRGDRTLSIELTTRPDSLFAFAGPRMPPVPEMPELPEMPVTPRLPAIPRVPVIPRVHVTVPPPLPNLPYLPALSAETAGMELATLTPTLGQYFGTDSGVLVIRAPHNDVFQLQDGDVIVAIGGRIPRNAGHATRILASYQPGERITLKILRRQQPMSLSITLPASGPA